MMDSLLSVVVNRAEDAALLRALLPAEHLERMRFYAAAGRVALATVGRNILVHEGGPVLIVMDSDTRNTNRADELRSITLAALRNFSPGGPLDVVTFIPETEVVFFETPAALERLLGTTMEESTLREGLLAPRATLDRLLRENGRGPGLPALLQSLGEEALDAVRSGPQACVLLDSVTSLLEPVGKS